MNFSSEEQVEIINGVKALSFKGKLVLAKDMISDIFKPMTDNIQNLFRCGIHNAVYIAKEMIDYSNDDSYIHETYFYDKKDVLEESGQFGALWILFCIIFLICMEEYFTLSLVESVMIANLISMIKFESDYIKSKIDLIIICVVTFITAFDVGISKMFSYELFIAFSKDFKAPEKIIILFFEKMLSIRRSGKMSTSLILTFSLFFMASSSLDISFYGTLLAFALSYIAEYIYNYLYIMITNANNNYLFMDYIHDLEPPEDATIINIIEELPQYILDEANENVNEVQRVVLNDQGEVVEVNNDENNALNDAEEDNNDHEGEVFQDEEIVAEEEVNENYILDLDYLEEEDEEEEEYEYEEEVIETNQIRYAGLNEVLTYEIQITGFTFVSSIVYAFLSGLIMRYIPQRVSYLFFYLVRKEIGSYNETNILVWCNKIAKKYQTLLVYVVSYALSYISYIACNKKISALSWFLVY